MKLVKVNRDGGVWQQLISEWEDEAANYEVDLSDYAPASIDVLADLAQEAPQKRAGVYALVNDSTFHGMCQLNVAFLPGYDGQVLRVRHIVHSPKYDLDDNVTLDDYATFLTHMFGGVLSASIDQMPAKHIKFHFRSPAERQFFAQMKDVLKDFDVFDSVEMRGAWLYLTKVGETG